MGDEVHRAYLNVVTAMSIRGEDGGSFDPAVNDAELAANADLAREAFGNPFRPVAPDPAWLTPTAEALGQAAYEERRLPSGELEAERLAILADALEEVGCSAAEIL